MRLRYASLTMASHFCLSVPLVERCRYAANFHLSQATDVPALPSEMHSLTKAETTTRRKLVSAVLCFPCAAPLASLRKRHFARKRLGYSLHISTERSAAMSSTSGRSGLLLCAVPLLSISSMSAFVLIFLFSQGGLFAMTNEVLTGSR